MVCAAYVFGVKREAKPRHRASWMDREGEVVTKPISNKFPCAICGHSWLVHAYRDADGRQMMRCEDPGCLCDNYAKKLMPARNPDSAVTAPIYDEVYEQGVRALDAAGGSAGHTPSPWFVIVDGAERRVGSDDGMVARADVFGEAGEANMLLIAAAPDLLAACKAALECLTSTFMIEPGMRGRMGLPGTFDLAKAWPDVVEKLNAAIKKAGG